MSVDKDLVNWLADLVGDDPDSIEIEFIPYSKSESESSSGVSASGGVPGLLNESAELPTHRCKNRVYRRGVTGCCGRLSMESVCKNCQQALAKKKGQLLGETTLSVAKRVKTKKAPPTKRVASARPRNVKEKAPVMEANMKTAKSTVKPGPTSKVTSEGFMGRLETALFEGKKEPSNKPDTEEFDSEFKTQCDEDGCDNHEPKDSGNRTSSLTDGPDGAKQTGSAYLK